MFQTYSLCQVAAKENERIAALEKRVAKLEAWRSRTEAIDREIAKDICSQVAKDHGTFMESKENERLCKEHGLWPKP